MVELALVLLVLLTLVMGALEIGRAVNAWAIVTQASREGARVGAATCTLDPGCAAAVDARVTSSLAGLPVADVTWTVDGGPYRAGDPFEVRVEYDFVPVTPFVGALIPGGGLTLVGETTMRLE